MRAYDAALFDLDGTLLDTSEGVWASTRYAIEEMKLPMVSQEVLRTFIGPPIQKSFARVYGLSEEKAAEAAAVFRNRYKDKDLLLATPYDGIFDAIKALSDAGLRTGVATYKRQDYALRLLAHYGFDKVCDVICGSDLEGKLTKRDIIKNAIKELGVSDMSRVVMIGDSDNDAIGAGEIGVPFVGVLYGFGFSSKEDVDAFANVGSAKTPADLPGCIL